MKLTQKAIEDLLCPPGQKDTLVFDDDVRGLGIRIAKLAKPGSLASKNYVLQFTFAGKNAASRSVHAHR